MSRLVAHVSGHVQGVGFRWWVKGQATNLGLTGSAENLSDGRVCVIAEGSEVAALLTRLQEKPSAYRRPGHVDAVDWSWEEPVGERGFHVS